MDSDLNAFLWNNLVLIFDKRMLMWLSEQGGNNFEKYL